MSALVVQVYWYHDTVTGDFHYRIKQPGLQIQKLTNMQVVNIHVLHPLFPDLALAADLLICYMCAEPEIGPLMRLRQKMGRPTMFEISDHFLAGHAGVPAGGGWRAPIIRERLLNHACQADALQMSTYGVARRYGGLNKHHRVFENRIEHFCAPRNARPDRVVLGWGGSMGHDHDLKVWKPHLLSLLQAFPNLHLSFMCPPDVFAAHFAGFPEQRVSFQAPGPLEAYYAFLETLDVGLAPAEDTPFNRCRSDGKFVEYAAHGVVPVLPDIEPFQRHAEVGRHKLLYGDVLEGVAHLRHLLTDAAFRERLAKDAFEWVARERQGACRDRLTFYGSLLEQAGSASTFEGKAEVLPDASGLMAHLRLAHAAHDAGGYDDAEARLNELLEAFPGYPQAQFALLGCWQASGNYEAIVAHLSAGDVPHAVYRDLSLTILVDALRKLGQDGEKAVQKIITDEQLSLELMLDRDPAKWIEVLKRSPFHCEGIRFLLSSQIGDDVSVDAERLLQVLDIIEDRAVWVVCDQVLGDLLKPFF